MDINLTRLRSDVIQNLHAIRSGFTSTFWVANALELFERLAFYASKAVLAVFLANKVGLENEAGTLTGFFSGMIFTLPIVAGVFVDRYGFRKTLITCFILFSIGYFLIGVAGMEMGQPIVAFMGKKMYVIVTLLLTAIGGSLIKPCIVGSISYTSKPDMRPIGFSIYYTLVNIGGSIGPILALFVREDFGIEYVFVMSSLICFLLFISTWLFYKEPEIDNNKEERRTFGKVFHDMLLVFSNIRFMLFLIIFSGFWVMFWQIYYTFPFYVIDVLHYPKFEVMETIDAWCIIVFTIPMAAMVKKWKPINAMVLGLIISSVAWITIGIWGTILAAVIGVGLFALGEAVQAPRFYEYVSSLAPKEQIGTFMGFAFLPIAIGSFIAGPLADWLRNTYLQTQPGMMWFIVCAIGIASTICLIVYNMYVVRKSYT